MTLGRSFAILQAGGRDGANGSELENRVALVTGREAASVPSP
jgi:hypothetical protein